MESTFMNFKVSRVSFVKDKHHILVKMQQDKTKIKWNEPVLQAQKDMWKREEMSSSVIPSKNSDNFKK
jgi:glycosylphosphatidylinositol transamidase (GPIT) subunit GPI8